MKIPKKEKKALLSAIKTDYHIREALKKPHTITALILMLIGLIYLAFHKAEDSLFVAFLACYFIFMLISLLQFPDSVFKRPHPAFWRLVKGTSIIYLLVLVFILFQTKDDVRQWLRIVDPTLGVNLPEKSYASNCSLTFENIYNQMDIFVPAHAIGWYFKALMLRDYYLCWVLSVMFEVMEYSLEHQLPNFAECWWDHWILDVLTCNALGIHLGILTCRYVNAKMYKWRGDIPHDEFITFQWVTGASTLKKYLGIIILVSAILAAELNTFYLKYLLWIPHDHYLNVIRLVIHVLMGCVAIREGYSYFSDNLCKNFGYQLWICIAVISVETLVCIKFGKGEFDNPFPTRVKVFWVCLITALTLLPIYKFYLKEKTKTD